jgi:hypothetical protein
VSTFYSLYVYSLGRFSARVPMLPVVVRERGPIAGAWIVSYDDVNSEPGDWASSEGEGDAWRGSEHLECWPEELAGPEYWAYRVREEVERAVIELVGEQTAKGE